MPQILKRLFSDPPSNAQTTDCPAATTPMASTASTAPTTPDGNSQHDDTAPLRLLRIVEEAECKLQEARDSWRLRWERDAVRLACRIAQRCLRDLPFDSVDLAAQLVEESLRGVRLDGRCEVRLNPTDFQQLSSRQGWPAHDITVLPDASIEPGGCLVKTPDGEIDQSLATQIARVEQELTDI